MPDSHPLVKREGQGRPKVRRTQELGGGGGFQKAAEALDRFVYAEVLEN